MSVTQKFTRWPGPGRFRQPGPWGLDLSHDWDDPRLPARPKSAREKARELVEEFRARAGGSAFFKHIGREELSVSLLARIDKPGLINQAGGSLCGPASLLFVVDSKDPVRYAEFAIDLYETGKGKIRKLEIKPGSDMRDFDPHDPANPMDVADWMMMASMRDSENWFFDLDEVGDEFAGITMPHELATWFKKAGFQEVENKTNIFLFSAGEGNALRANKLYQEGWWVCLFINAKMLEEKTKRKSSVVPDHWIVLTSPMEIINGNISFEIFTWGNGHRSVPELGVLSVKDFLDNYYGHVAARY